jgi:RNA polymerase sigma-70 factor (ECF subfamily)
VASEPTAEELLARIGGGDPAAFAALWERFARPVIALARRTLGDPVAAEDAAQEAFSTIWRAAGTFDTERGTAAAWIFTIARNAARDIARRRRLHLAAELPDRADPDAGPDEQALAAHDAFLVHAAIAELAPRARQVIELAYYKGLTQSEIAAQLMVPLGTVKTRTRNALAQLADRLSPVEERR